MNLIESMKSEFKTKPAVEQLEEILIPAFVASRDASGDTNPTHLTDSKSKRFRNDLKEDLKTECEKCEDPEFWTDIHGGIHCSNCRPAAIKSFVRDRFFFDSAGDRFDIIVEPEFEIWSRHKQRKTEFDPKTGLPPGVFDEFTPDPKDDRPETGTAASADFESGRLF